MRAKEAELRNLLSGRKGDDEVVLKIKTNQITTTFLRRKACFHDAFIFTLEKLKFH